MTPPLVSCIMPTRNRRRFAGQALWYFLRQDYPHRELVVIDDGEDSIADLMPNDSRIRYVRLDRPLTLGAKRNLACELAHGDYIAHWDDDDWFAAHRLSAQMAALIEHAVGVCGLRELLYFKPHAGEAWRYRYPSNEAPWLAGGSLLYRRAVWAAYPFPAINVGEDTAFVAHLPPEQLYCMPDDSFYVGLIHDSNTSGKNLADPRWERQPLDTVAARIMLDRAFYVALRNNFVAPPATVLPCASLTVVAPFMIYDGYGSMAEYLVLGLLHAGAQVNPVPIGLDQRGLTAELQTCLQRSQPQPDAPVLYFCWPRAELERYRHTSDLFINTMWESSRLPAAWLEPLNRARTIIVPTRFVADVCRRSGVRSPLAVVPEGIDPAIYHAIERPERAGLTTLIVGTYIERKHTAEGIAAWKQAFAHDQTARLLIKARFDYRNYTTDDPRITFIDTNEPTRGIAQYYAQADVLLALGNEGFGLPLVEGMATALPVIVLNSEGQADVCTDAPDVVLPVEPVRWEPYAEAPWGACGVRGVPGITDVARQLRWVAEHRAEARAMGQAAATWARRERNIWSKAPAVLDLMEQALQPARPLRQLHTFWIPSWGTACGIAEYTTHIVDGLRGNDRRPPTEPPLQVPLRITPTAPDLRATRLLHIQHEHGLFNDMALTAVVQRAKAAQLPVVVTEHSVIAGTQPWERDADVLLALTERGTARLKAQHPGKRIEYMPHGCPTWFPVRKRTRSRVLGAFGFLEQHKGFWQLLDVLRALPNTELRLFSYSKRASLLAEWQAAAQGLPVQHVSEFLPTAEIARRLAAEADLLVFWYDEHSTAAASGAVRVGLATGVPVLTSPTGWFHDLQGVTFQPADLVSGIQQGLDDTPLREQLVAAAQDYCHEHSWPRIAERHQVLWRSLDSV